MKIISHRGAKGLGDENSLKTITRAAELNIDYIEFDIQTTSNNVVVVYHDTVTPKGFAVKERTYKTLQREISYIPTLTSALKACGKVPALVESKARGSFAKSVKILGQNPNISLTSFFEDEVLSARINMPDHKVFYLQKIHPIGIVGKAKNVDATGIGINKNWLLLLPFYYWQSRKNKLEIYTYTLNWTFLSKVITKIMPNIYICTDHPDALLPPSKK